MAVTPSTMMGRLVGGWTLVASFAKAVHTATSSLGCALLDSLASLDAHGVHAVALDVAVAVAVVDSSHSPFV